MGIYFKDYDQTMLQEFEEMLLCYFTDDIHSELSPDIIRKKIVCPIVESWERGTPSLCIACEDQTSVGFCIYQIDSPESDWCKKEGWGFIREFYIKKPFRGRGYGRKLAAFTEKMLFGRGVQNMYLTADDAIGFWQTCGYADSGTVNENGTHTMTKEKGDRPVTHR